MSMSNDEHDDAVRDWVHTRKPDWAHDLPRTAAQWLDHDVRRAFSAYEMHRAQLDELLNDINAHVKSVERVITCWTSAYLWAALARSAPEVAERVARDIALACEAGDSFGEWTWQWADELRQGLPITLPGLDGPQ